MFTLNTETTMDGLVISNETRFLNHAPQTGEGAQGAKSSFSSDDEPERREPPQTANCIARCEFKSLS